MLEVCCGSLEDGLNAYQAGAKRIELNRCLSVGGLTASLSDLKRLKQETDLTIMCMVRVREGGFIYNDFEWQQMLDEAQTLLEAGSDGIVFGCLTKEFKVDDRSQQMVDLIHSYKKVAVFHRAIDVVDDYEQAIQKLVQMGVDRLLTSGQEPTALAGLEKIKLARSYPIEVLPGSGIRPTNVDKLLNELGSTDVHASCSRVRIDESSQRGDVDFGYESFGVVEVSVVQQMLNHIDTDLS